ncbi:MAG: nucleotide exchange factor GrpE [Metamycoplasmataceae bacterium]
MKTNNKIIKENDILDFDYVLTKNGEIIENSKYENLIVGQENNDFIIPNVSDLIIGKEISNDKIVSVKFNSQNESNFENKNDEYTLTMTILKQVENQDYKNNKKPFNDENNDDWNQDMNEFEEKESIFSLKNKNSKKDIAKLNKEIDLLKEKNNSLIQEYKTLENTFKSKMQEVETKTKNKIEEIQYLESTKAKNAIEEAKKYSLQKFVEELISPLLNLENAINFGSTKGSDEVQQYTKGFKLLTNQIFNVLDDFGIKEIDPKVGSEFNPELHHIFELENSNDFDENQIIEVKTKGYELNGRVIKPAFVIVCGKK